MPPDFPDLNALIGSRICHDLSSPLGAIANGVELLEMSGIEAGPEMALIRESVRNASRRIRFFRIAFGAATADQTVAERELRDLLAPDPGGRKLQIDWQPQGDIPRPDAKLAFLLINCCETAMPRGGLLRVTAGDRWHIAAEGARILANAGLWHRLSGPNASGDLAAAHVHFALAAQEAARQGRVIDPVIGDAGIRIGF